MTLSELHELPRHRGWRTRYDGLTCPEHDIIVVVERGFDQEACVYIRLSWLVLTSRLQVAAAVLLSPEELKAVVEEKGEGS